MEHCNGDGAGPGHGHTHGRGDSAGAAREQGGGGGGGGKAFGTMTENVASPLPLNKALRMLKSLWFNFALIAKSALSLQIKTIKIN